MVSNVYTKGKGNRVSFTQVGYTTQGVKQLNVLECYLRSFSFIFNINPCVIVCRIDISKGPEFGPRLFKSEAVMQTQFLNMVSQYQ